MVQWQVWCMGCLLSSSCLQYLLQVVSLFTGRFQMLISIANLPLNNPFKIIAEREADVQAKKSLEVKEKL